MKGTEQLALWAETRERPKVTRAASPGVCEGSERLFPAITCQGGIFLLTEEGKIYSLVVNETQLDQPRSYKVQLALRKVSKCLPHLSVRHMHSNQSSAVYLTGNGQRAAATPDLPPEGLIRRPC